VKALHTAFALGEGALLTFFDVRGRDFEAPEGGDLDAHIELEVSDEQLDLFLAQAREAGIPAKGPTDHRLARSIYLRDPNGYMVELIAKSPLHDQIMGFAGKMARPQLSEWQRAKAPESVPA
jgi:catechol-2,3-dioxygenase